MNSITVSADSRDELGSLLVTIGAALGGKSPVMQAMTPVSQDSDEGEGDDGGDLLNTEAQNDLPVTPAPAAKRGGKRGGKAAPAAPAAPAPAPVATPAPAATTITAEDLRALGHQLIKLEKRPEMKEALTAEGAESITKADPSHYAGIKARFEAIIAAATAPAASNTGDLL